MADFVNTIDLLGDEAVAKAIVERTITEYNDDTIDSIGDYAFSNCSALTSVDLPNATSIGGRAFEQCKALTSVDLPIAIGIGSSAFDSCSLTNINLPNAEKIESYAFRGCKKLTEVNVPKVTVLNDMTFYLCPFTSIDLPKVSKMNGRCFSACANLNLLVLRSETLCALGGTNVFEDTPFAAGKAGGTVYVPQALIAAYQTATNWSTLYAAGTCNFVAIEGSEYE